MVLVGQLLVGDVREMRGGILRVEVGVGGGWRACSWAREYQKRGARQGLFFARIVAASHAPEENPVEDAHGEGHGEGGLVRGEEGEDVFHG